MGKIAFVFSGQGAQYSGMGKSLYEVSPAAKALFDTADKIRPQTTAQCFEGSDETLKITENTQPCVFCVDLAAALALKEAGITPDGISGFSLGEVVALTFAESFSIEDGIKLVIQRAKLMNTASETSKSAMAAVLKLEPQKVLDICNEVGDSYAINFNCPGQIVVATKRDNIDALVEAVKAAGGKAMPLAVSGGFHSPFMQTAYEGFQKVLEETSFIAPAISVYANSTAEPYETANKEQLASQIVKPVYWQKTIENMARDGYDTFIEVGPGKTLCGLIKKTLPEAKIYNVQDADSLSATIKALKGE